jgi:Ran GTPase-activating protein (RanGAP) involved in mRNA processing and transport
MILSSFCPQPGAEHRSAPGQTENHQVIPMAENPSNDNGHGVTFDRKTRSTLFLTGGIRREKTITRCRRAMHDSARFRNIHIVGHAFVEDEKDNASCLNYNIRQLLVVDSRNWGSIKVTGCRGSGLPYLIQSICSSNVRKLTLSLPRGEEINTIQVLSHGLKKNETLVILGIHNTDLTEAVCSCLERGLNSSNIIELSVQKSRFTDTASSSNFAKAIRFSKTIQTLTFRDCGMSDTQVYDILSALSLSGSVKDLTLDGNYFGKKASEGVIRLLETGISNLSDLSMSGLLSDRFCPLDLSGLAQSIACSSLSSLQLSDNMLSDKFMEKLSASINLTNLKVLNLSWATISKNGLIMLADALTVNTTLLQKVILHDAQLCDASDALVEFACRLPAMKVLKSLDLGGNHDFSEHAICALVKGLAKNTSVEEVSIHASDESARAIEMLTDLNRAGRRWFSDYDSAPVALFPLVLGRAQRIPMPSFSGESWWFEDHHNSFDSDISDTIRSDSVSGEDRNEFERRATVMFELIRNTL